MTEVIMDWVLRELQRWYAGRCNGDWEHGFGVEITTLDNPGWSVKIDLAGTELEDRAFETFQNPAGSEDFVPSDRWIRCWVADGAWHGVGDETRLTEILQAFLSWSDIH